MGVYTINRENEDDLDEDDEDDGPKGICCLGGCLTGCSFAMLLLVILPAGVLLTFYSANNNDYGVMSAGVLMIVIPLISGPIFLAIFYNRRRIRMFRKRKIQSTPPKEQTDPSTVKAVRY